MTFQLWDWDADGEQYDMRHIQLHLRGDTYEIRVRRTASWAVRHERVSALATAAGFVRPAWQRPEQSGFPQPILTATRPQD